MGILTIQRRINGSVLPDGKLREYFMVEEYTNFKNQALETCMPRR